MSRRLTIYTDKYDSQENVCGNGMSGKVFLDVVEETGRGGGQEFKSLDEALETLDEDIDSIDFMYLTNDGTQKYARFNVNNGKYKLT